MQRPHECNFARQEFRHEACNQTSSEVSRTRERPVVVRLDALRTTRRRRPVCEQFTIRFFARRVSPGDIGRRRSTKYLLTMQELSPRRIVGSFAEFPQAQPHHVEPVRLIFQILLKWLPTRAPLQSTVRTQRKDSAPVIRLLPPLLSAQITTVRLKYFLPEKQSDSPSVAMCVDLYFRRHL
jgi:hypothetical protein